MCLNIRMIIAGLCLLATLAVARAEENCDVKNDNCTCSMPKLYDCPEVNLNLMPVDGCQLLKDELAGPDFSNLTCGVNDTYSPLSNDGVYFTANGKWLQFENDACENDFYFIVDLDGGQLVKTVKLENRDVTNGEEVFFEFAYGYTVPCTDQPTINTLLWQYITPGWYAPDANITEVWNRLNFTDGVFHHKEISYFKAAYLFIHFNHIPIGSRFKLSMTGCHEQAKDIDPALDYLNNLLSVTNDTLEIADGISVSGTALDQESNLTNDEVILFLDAFTRLGEEAVDLSTQPEKAKNLTKGLAEVASKVLDSISVVTLPTYDPADTYLSTPAGPYTKAANTGTTDTPANPDKKVADQQATAILTIEKAIGVITSSAGNATIVAKTKNIIIVSAPVRVTDATTTQPIRLSGADDSANDSGEGSEDVAVEASVDLSDIARHLDGTSSSNTATKVRFTALQIKSDEFLNTKQNVNFDVSPNPRENEEVESSKVLLNSDILSLTIYVNGTPRSVPLKAQYRTKKMVESSQTSTIQRNKSSICVWLTDNKTWSHEGCSTNRTDAWNTDCSCEHTTSFAVLVQVVDFEISKANNLALKILSYFGIGLSILCLVIALFIFFSVGALRTSERNMIHRNLMIALLLAYIVFLAGVEYAKDIKVVCTVVAALLHYLYLTVFGWMLIEGIHLYLMLVKVFGSEGSKQIYYLLIGWGAPVIIVAISVGMKYNEYGTPELCWLKPGSSVIYAFVGPVIAVILFNFFVLCMVLRIIYRSSAINVDCPIDQVKAAAKGSIALLPILGITWCLGIFALGKDTIVFQYLFVICNSTQGILLFVFHCLFNSEVRNALKREQEKMGWSTAGTQSKKNKVHPEDTGHSTAKGLTTKGSTKTTGAEEKSVMAYHSAQDPSSKGLTGVEGPAGKTNAGPKKTSPVFTLPGQMDDSLDEAQTSTIRQEIKTEREMEQGGWKINEKKHVQRTFVRVEDSQ